MKKMALEVVVEDWIRTLGESLSERSCVLIGVQGLQGSAVVTSTQSTGFSCRSYHECVMPVSVPVHPSTDPGTFLPYVLVSMYMIMSTGEVV